MRGREARTHTKSIVIIIVFMVRKRSFRRIIGRFPKKKIVVRRLIMIMFAYSAIKIKAKGPPLYSVLNPETSSDSPSAKSKGVRFVSARVVVNQISPSGMSIVVVHERFVLSKRFRSKEKIIISVVSRINAILTS